MINFELLRYRNIREFFFSNLNINSPCRCWAQTSTNFVGSCTHSFFILYTLLSLFSFLFIRAIASKAGLFKCKHSTCYIQRYQTNNAG